MTPYQLGYIHGNNGSKPIDMYDEKEELDSYQAGHEAGTLNAKIMAQKENEKFGDKKDF